MSLMEDGHEVAEMLVGAMNGREGTALSLAVGIGEFYLRSLLAIQSAGCDRETILEMIEIIGNAHDIAKKSYEDGTPDLGTLQ